MRQRDKTLSPPHPCDVEEEPHKIGASRRFLFDDVASLSALLHCNGRRILHKDGAVEQLAGGIVLLGQLLHLHLQLLNVAASRQLQCGGATVRYCRRTHRGAW
ncbi:hypothetical protein DQ04_02581040 [Trypanosoma grayi]|uniref:hypothetical protein n=1 Tax=Trypanosoma grayi TaxID=71804 RepID=UPI0004F45616|nr:hypothetical protein DQ04_02581040 [Trypanosoma grayi]KEG11476.1 hypothetical protein DQ04_02581040 [Trypanosoma grayi]